MVNESTSGRTSAKKYRKQSLARALRNKARLSSVKTCIKKTMMLLKDDVGSSEQHFSKAQSCIMRAVTKGVLKLNTASRKISKLHKKLHDITFSSANNES